MGYAEDALEEIHGIKPDEPLHHSAFVSRLRKSEESTLSRTQSQLKVWHDHNFGEVPSWQPLLGLQEELGELSHSFLKRAQNIRTNEDHDLRIKDAVGDIMIFLLDFCNNEGLDAEAILEKTWHEVRERNWRPEKGELPRAVFE